MVMRVEIYLFAALLLITSSCAATRKQKESESSRGTESNIPGTTTRRTLAPSSPVEEPKESTATKAGTGKPEKKITEVEKRIVTDNDTKPNPKRYFVILGSFRNPENARKQSAVIENEGFKPEILKTEEGLYRISVMATDDADNARSEVRRIWMMFPRYSDAWMLKSMTP